jgi:hypothetical protein
MSIIDSIGFVEDRRLPQLRMDAEALQRDRLLKALTQRRRRARVRVHEHAPASACRHSIAAS